MTDREASVEKSALSAEEDAVLEFEEIEDAGPALRQWGG